MHPLIKYALPLLGLAFTTSDTLIAQERDRSKIADKYKWNLTDIFSSDEAWKNSKQKLAETLPAIEKYQGTLGSSAQQLLGCLELVTNLNKEFSRLYSYASMSLDQDTRVQTYLGMQQEMSQLDSGSDVWLNNPRKPLEASGTSGMKILIHGGLNLSVMDSWWREGFNGENGWKIGNDKNDNNENIQDEKDFESLIKVLTEYVIPEFYDRDETGIPRKWIKRIRNSMETLIPKFNTDRMVAEYVNKYYLTC